MYIAHLILTRADCPEPTQEDAERILDGLRAQAPANLNIEHIRVRAGPGCIDVILFFRTTIHSRRIPAQRAALAAIRNMPLLRDWRVIFAHDEEEGIT